MKEICSVLTCATVGTSQNCCAHHIVHKLFGTDSDQVALRYCIVQHLKLHSRLWEHHIVGIPIKTAGGLYQHTVGPLMAISAPIKMTTLLYLFFKEMWWWRMVNSKVVAWGPTSISPTTTLCVLPRNVFNSYNWLGVAHRVSRDMRLEHIPSVWFSVTASACAHLLHRTNLVRPSLRRCFQFHLLWLALL